MKQSPSHFQFNHIFQCLKMFWGHGPIYYLDLHLPAIAYNNHRSRWSRLGFFIHVGLSTVRPLVKLESRHQADGPSFSKVAFPSISVCRLLPLVHPSLLGYDQQMPTLWISSITILGAVWSAFSEWLVWPNVSPLHFIYLFLFIFYVYFFFVVFFFIYFY